jgi:hypothetical protein
VAIITKRIKNRSYAYLVNREGKKVVHKYLGPANDPSVEKMILNQKETTAVPEHFRTLFWDTDLKNIHMKRNARYIIERILEFGSLDALNWLQRVYTVQNIIDVLSTGRGMSQRSRIFWKLWFGVEDA